MVQRLGACAAAIGLAGAALAAGLAQHPSHAQPAAVPAPSPRPARAIAPDQRRAFFGELHLHTLMSFDAWTFGTKVTPDQAYKFARGETVLVSPAQVAVQQGLTVAGPVPARRAWALDFAAVTDHSEYIGAVAQLEDPQSALSPSKIGPRL
jgi:hypothetical protein